MALRDRIFAIDDITTERVPIPEWSDADGSVVVEARSLPLGLRNTLANASKDKNGDVDSGLFQPRLVIAGTYDPSTGEQVFLDSDLPPLQGRNSGVMDRLSKVIMRLSGLVVPGDEEQGAEDAAEAVEEAGKDSSSTVSSDFDSLSPSDFTAQSSS